MVNAKVEKTLESNGSYGVDSDDLSNDSETEREEEDTDTDDDSQGDTVITSTSNKNRHNKNDDIQAKLAAAGPTGVAAAAAIGSARKRRRNHTFETNPAIRKRQQTRLIRKLKASIDEYTMRIGQQAIVLITMPGKSQNNFKVFGAQPLENVIKACKREVMTELEHALLEHAPKPIKDNSNKHELPPLVIDGIPTPVEKMTQAQLRAFIPLMLKYSTGRGKPGWGKNSTRPPWWPETLPWANVRSDARDEDEKQRNSWTTTLRQIVLNCYKYHKRDDLLPTFSENEEATKGQEDANKKMAASRKYRLLCSDGGEDGDGTVVMDSEDQQQQLLYQTQGAYGANFVHTVANPDGTMSIIQLDPNNAQILTLPDGTQVRAVRLQTIDAESFANGDVANSSIQLPNGAEAISIADGSINMEGQLIVTNEDGTQTAYPMANLVTLPADMYPQFAEINQQLGIAPTEESDAASEHANIESSIVKDSGDVPPEGPELQDNTKVGVEINGSCDKSGISKSGNSSRDLNNNQPATGSKVMKIDSEHEDSKEKANDNEEK